MKVNKFAKRRVLFLFLIFIVMFSYMFYTVFTYWRQILNNNREKNQLENNYEELLEKENLLQNDVIRLQDPEYVAKYAREKYLYTKDGELIIKIIEDSE